MNPLPNDLMQGTCIGLNFGMGFAIIIPTVPPERVKERGIGRLGTRPWDHQPAQFVRKPNPFAIVR